MEESLCPDGDPECGAADERDTGSITVTGSTISPRNAAIINNQMRGVDEGDIVKQIGHYLIVLSDGRLFVIDTRAGSGRGLALADRVNVYRDPEADTWYDELLVFGDRLLVTGYSDDDEASELSVFRLAADGTLTAEGVFHISSDDYYDTSNYATRMVGDSLVVYTPYGIGGGWSDPGFELPVVRRWMAGEDRDEARERGRPLFDARSIYRPVRLETNPTIHSVSVCPLGPVGRDRDLECRTTAFAAADTAEWYVTANEAFLSSARYELDPDDPCEEKRQPSIADTVPSVLYRVPHDGGAPEVAGARGLTFDQFSLQANDGRLRALVDQRPERCYRDYSRPVEPIYFEAPLSIFSNRYVEASPSHYAEVPNPGTRWIANRFTERHLVYGGLSQHRRGLPDIDWDQYDEEEDEEVIRWRRQGLARPPAFVVPAGRPRDVSRLDIGHTVIRAERYGANDVVLTGYRGRRGLSMTLIDLDRAPSVASTLLLEGRFESEGRSHAFNSLVEPNGSGMIGIPTSPKISDSRREWWRSRASDISYVSVGRHGMLGDMGLIESRVTFDRRGNDEDGLPDYVCEVSCIDWYGNSRPIFTDGRIFALTGVELVEGFVEDGTVQELRRFDFARARPRVRR